ncbi:hypothetical protein BPOR_0152g00070 [Botrytis porri]|uniref:rRNA methyltransferase 2, mitochondrial n=1 Tax=Botrytis porri TaxID=87229 RepID=A0A4Z1KVS4_9HELO|nr:hypothetical protein BPOR_0152g00070 [Botrytis porri]
MLPPRLNPTFSTSGLGFLPRSHSCTGLPALLNHKAGLTIARGRFGGLRNGIGVGVDSGSGSDNGLGRNARIETQMQIRSASSSSSSSSTRWKSRQGKDAWAREAKVKGLRSRAAFKLLEIDTKYKIFKRGQTVVDLVAYTRTQPHGRILGIDIIPAQPPAGVSTIQGNFLSRRVQQSVKNFLLDPERGRPRRPIISSDEKDEDEEIDDLDVAAEEQSYIDLERHMDDDMNTYPTSSAAAPEEAQEEDREPARDATKMVHVVLSDMCAPWEQTTGFWKRSLSDPYNRMMNTTGIKFSDHAGSMGAEDKELELKLRKMFAMVHREKPESSRSESKEAYFVALRRNGYRDAASLGFVNDV